MLYDDRVKQAVAQAVAEGHEGEALAVRVGRLIDAEVKVDSLKPAEFELLKDAFKKYVHKPKAKRAAKADPQPKLPM